ncbi:MAG TPA: site-2 protease family protein [Polyangiaceae bacterium]|nr:site-2 protease family protein [Polyangiaceae bacterium]
MSFRIGKIPVEILPSFFLVALFLGLAGASGVDLAGVAVWMIVVLGSVLMHELGHASMGLVFGLGPRIQLHGMGGTTSWQSAPHLSSVKRIAISLAGPAAGFVLATLVFVLRRPLAEWLPGDLGRFVVGSLLWVNFGWGILNLLPMLPLDGGNVLLHALNAVTRGRGERPARLVSVACAAAALLLTLWTQRWWSAMLSGSFIASNWRGLKDLSASEHDAPMRASLERAYAALDEKDGPKILEIARPVALQSRTAPVRAEALQLLAFGFLLEGRVADADSAIAAMPPGFSPHPSLTELRREVGTGAR